MATKTKVSSAEETIKDIRRETRRKWNAEEKIRIVLEGLRGEDSIAELCRREGLSPNLYYKWSKEFLEAGKARLTGDTKRQANSSEVDGVVVENSIATWPVRQPGAGSHAGCHPAHLDSPLVLQPSETFLEWDTARPNLDAASRRCSRSSIHAARGADETHRRSVICPDTRCAPFSPIALQTRSEHELACGLHEHARHQRPYRTPG